MNHNSTPVISMPESASWIVNKLTDRGYQVCLFGACVRDSLLGITPDAWNIATSASPEEVRSLFGKTGDAGCGYGTITVSRLVKRHGTHHFSYDPTISGMSAAFIVQFSPALIRHTSGKDILSELSGFINLVFYLVPDKRYMLPLVDQDRLGTIV